MRYIDFTILRKRVAYEIQMLLVDNIDSIDFLASSGWLEHIAFLAGKEASDDLMEETTFRVRKPESNAFHSEMEFSLCEGEGCEECFMISMDINYKMNGNMSWGHISEKFCVVRIQERVRQELNGMLTIDLFSHDEDVAHSRPYFPSCADPDCWFHALVSA